MKTTINTWELPVGSVGVVAGYSRAYGGYTGKLITKGLTPGTCFVLLDFVLSEGVAQILLQEKIITLSKPEVNALCVDAVENDF